MKTRTEIPKSDPIIIMTRDYRAPRNLVWEAITQPRHVQQWWGGPGFSNPVCEMDVRVGGHWHHVMRFPDGHELPMHFVFLEIEAPKRLVWQNAEHGTPVQGPPTCVMHVTLEDLGAVTRWTLLARFESLDARAEAMAIGFSTPIEASSERLEAYLATQRAA